MTEAQIKQLTALSEEFNRDTDGGDVLLNQIQLQSYLRNLLDILGNPEIEESEEDNNTDN